MSGLAAIGVQALSPAEYMQQLRGTTTPLETMQRIKETKSPVETMMELRATTSRAEDVRDRWMQQQASAPERQPTSRSSHVDRYA